LHNHVKANEYFDRSIALAPDQQGAYAFKALNYWRGWGDTKQSRATLEAMPKRVNRFSCFFWISQELLERNWQAALDRLAAQPYEVFELPSAVLPKEYLAGLVYSATGQPELAQRAFESALILLGKEVAERPDDARVHSTLGLVYARLGRKEEAIREGQLGVELYPISRDAMHGPEFVGYLAEIYMVIGNHEAALDKIEYLLSIPGALCVPMLRLNPTWDPLRDHPRFQRLLEQYSKSGS
jgi:serine/threonine-protein kinase